MARIRSVKPEFWNDEKLGQEPEGIMLTFIGLWNFSDDYSVVRANPTWLKSQIYPYKDKLRIDAFTGWLKRLVDLEAVIPFTYRGESYYCIRTFRKHQKPDRPSKARNCPEDQLMLIMSGLGYKLNDEGEFVKHSTSTRRVFDEYSPQEEEEYREEYQEEEETGPNGQLSLSGKEEYKSIGKDKKNISVFIRGRRPDFIDPYIDLWNLFAKEKGFPAASVINDNRKKKFKVRIREKEFDFLEVLKKAAQSEWLCTKGKWFTFDWILENSTNYLKVLEGNYDNAKKTEQNDTTTQSANATIAAAIQRHQEEQAD